ncbi:MAG: UbiA family prenyltransferase [Desulfobacterales bacterium]|nr:UbiA family prenyltransferase [Desulfobacterales bacterium]
MIKPFFELCRVSNLPTVWTNVLAAVVLSGGAFPWAGFIVLAGSMSLYYSAGMCLNDICDVKQDARNRPLRPIPSGRITRTNALIITVLLFVAAFALLGCAPFQRALYGGFVLTVVIVLYDRFHKAHPLSVLLMATCRLLVFVITGIAVSGSLGLIVALGGGAQFIYTLALSIVARYENHRDRPFSIPVIPLMIAGMSLLDGVVMAICVAPAWFIAGLAGAMLTRYGQRYVRGD